MKQNLCAGLALCALAAITQAQAQFVPIPLTTDSYNNDIVVEKEAPRPFVPATTASMDGGTNNSGNTYYEIGYNVDAPATGIPAAGATFVSESLPDHSFTMAASYTTNNGLLIDRTLTNSTLTLNAPAAYSAISLLTAAANGAVVLNYTLHFAGGATETGTVTAPDWFNATPTAVTANGRVEPATGNFANVDSGNPRLYSVDIVVTNSTASISSVEFTFGSGGANGRAGIFAVSGSTGADFTPIAISGFNQDMIVEAGSARPTPLGVTDASMDAGTANTGFTLYERGYNTNSPTSGLPLPGTTLTNATATDHVYRFAPSYTSTPNVALIDAVTAGATLTFATPASHSALSLLGSSGGGAVTLTYQINHADSTTQTGTIVIPDWFNVTPFAYAVRGRVHVENTSFNAVDTENPRLYSVDIAVERTTTPITSVQLTYASGSGHAAIFGLSGTAGAVKPIFDVQPSSTNAFVATTAELIATVSGTAPITFQWQRDVNGTYVTVTNSATVTGATTSTIGFSNLTLGDAGNYILIASNSAGSSTSSVARLNILSDKTDVTTPTDEITIYNGSSPGNEPVANAIDDTTTKYLNFGADGNTDAGFTGPAGLVVTPAVGSTVVTGLRVYTANDSVDRDPVDYTLEGSDDGTTFTVISTGTLALPAERNAAGLTLEPLTQPNTEVNFANTAGYTTYRLSFNNVKNNATANSFQVGEIELLGVPGDGTPQGPTLQIARSGTGVTISWNGPGTLEATPTLNNPQWTSLGTTNPQTVETTGNARFFRVVQ